MKIIDSHTHIDYITCDLQPEVVGCVCCAVVESDWNNIVDLVKQDKRVYGAFGVHPWFVESLKDGFDIRLENLLKTDSDYMVGEIGLDKHKPNMEKQVEVFVAQLDVAVKLKRTVFLHCVGAWDKILHILKQYKQNELPMLVVHNFDENDTILKRLLKYENVFFSISKNVVYDRNYRIEQIPINRILIETDAKKDVLLKDVLMRIITIKNDDGVPEIIYNNTLKVLNK